MLNCSRLPEFRILFVLTGLASHYKKSYVYPSQKTILEKLFGLYGLRMSRRTLCRHLKAFEQAGYITRRRRIERCPKRGTMFRSTLYEIKRKAWLIVKSAVSSVGKAINLAAHSVVSSRVPKTAHNGTSRELYNPASTKTVDKSVDKSVEPRKVGAFFDGLRDLLSKK